MSAPTAEEVAELIAAQVRARHPGAPPAALARLLRAEWAMGLGKLGEALADATAAAREAERERVRVAEVRARWVDAWPALLDLAELAELAEQLAA